MATQFFRFLGKGLGFVKDKPPCESCAPSDRDRSAEDQSKKLAHKYRFNRLSVRKRAKFLLRKHQRRKSKEHREQKEVHLSTYVSFVYPLHSDTDMSQQHCAYRRLQNHLLAPRPKQIVLHQQDN